MKLLRAFLLKYIKSNKVIGNPKIYDNNNSGKSINLPTGIFDFLEVCFEAKPRGKIYLSKSLYKTLKFDCR